MKIKKAVIPAAGLGTRMLPATKAIPKEMINIVDKPAIQYVVEEIVEAGIEDILIITGRNKGVMEDYFDYSYELDDKLFKDHKIRMHDAMREIANMANVMYVRQREPKGLGHAVYRARSFTGDEPFALLLGDDIIYNRGTCAIGQMVEAYSKAGASILGVQKVPHSEVSKYGNVKPQMVDDRLMKVLDMVEKPSPEEAFSDYAALGRYVLTKEVYRELETTPVGKGGEIQLTDALKSLTDKEGLFAYDFVGRRYDTGNKQGYLEAVVEYALRHEEVADSFRAYLKRMASQL
ncbi:MAG: UTP--glucose-1-phosphate uridylyltransferase GalU [Eubacteriales bacterium]|jgi:UTP--glucose-1-phosphate uridylyltransferase